MSTSEERMRILKMISDKQITAEEGARLLEALRASESDTRDHPEPSRSRWLHVRVTDRTTGKTKMNVNVPVGLVDVGLKMGARFAPDLAGMDMQAIQGALKNGYQGKLVDVDDEVGNERVEVFVE
jgi:SHOCT-like domain